MPIITLPTQSGSSGSGQNVWNPSMGPGGLPGFDEGSGGTTPNPVYAVAWDSETLFLTQTDIEVRFVVSRMDGELCDVPQAATGYVATPDGTLYEAAQSIEGGGQAAEQVVSSAYLAATAGTYYIAVRITMPDGRIIGNRQKVYVRI